jgi:UDP-N-acetylmuramyl pentapeptide phosphotransferase/UDP-N-acetylglucosamine-1-phosphate transferase
MNPLLAFLVSIICCYACIPSVIRIAINKRVLDQPGPRKIHSRPVPLLGGAAIFLAFMLSFTFFGARFMTGQHAFILTGLSLLFFLGLRDDLHPLSPGVKFSGQLTAAVVVVLLGGIRVTDMGGFLGINQLPEPVASAFSVLLIVFLINAVNFIDGVDGLAGALMLLLFLTHAVLFLYSPDQLFAVLCMAGAGTMAGFLFYNFSPARIFMGDAGSVPVGFLAAVSSVRLCGLHAGSGHASTGIILAFAIVLLPAADALRMVLSRIRGRRSPFKADTEHIHHVLLRSGWSAAKITAFLTGVQAIIFIIAWYIKGADPSWVLPLGTLAAILVLSLTGRPETAKIT